MNSIRLRFLGAVGTVSGSCTLIEYNKKNYYLVDAGLYQNEFKPQLEETREKILKKYAGKIECIFLTHAHLDHIGILPHLYKWGFKGIIFGTKATIALTKIMLEDLININNKNNSKTRINPNIIKRMKFSAFDENRGMTYFNGFGKKYSPLPLNKNLQITILRTSHILGSCSYLFRYTEEEGESFENFEKIKFLYFTGDIGPVTDDVKTNILFKEHQIPFDNEYKTIVMESTYGGMSRKKRNYIDKMFKLHDIIRPAIENDKTVIIPAFALDRAQQILVDLQMVSDYSYVSKRVDFYDAIAQYKADSQGDYVTGVFEYIPTEEFSAAVITKINTDINSLLFTDLRHLFDRFPPEIQQQIKAVKKRINVGISSPLIRKINKVYLEHLSEEVFSEAREKEPKRKYKYLSDSFLEKFSIEGEVSPEQKEAIKEKLGQCFDKDEDGNVIVSSSGMCDEGAILDLLKKHLRDENSIIILTGYQANNTNGFKLKKYLNGEFDKNNLDDKLSFNKIDLQISDIKCEIVDMSEYYSGHADQEQLINYVNNSRFNKKSIKTTVFLNHGEFDAQNKLKEAIDEKGNDKITVKLPEFNRWYNIITGEEDDDDPDESEPDGSEPCRSLNIDGIQIQMSVPKGYSEEKLKKIIEYINNYPRSP